VGAELLRRTAAVDARLMTVAITGTVRFIDPDASFELVLGTDPV
jgi:hypothetical protein